MYLNPWQPRPKQPFDEKAWKRDNLSPWEARWLRLEPEARLAFVTQVKVPAPKGKRWTASTPASDFAPAALDQLVAAGFVGLQAAAKKQQVIAAEGAHDFLTRVRALRRYHLLDAGQPSDLVKYANYCFATDGLTLILHGILRQQGIFQDDYLQHILQHYVVRHRWPGWALRAVANPLAEQVLTLFQEAPRPIPLAELPGRIAGSDPAAVRATVNTLLTHLVLFEDLAPDTWDILVGLLPAVREDLVRSRQPRQRPPLLTCPDPREVAAEGGLAVNDLRVLLLELAGEPPLLRQDGTLFQKEQERFLQALDPLPEGLSQALKLSTGKRLQQALHWAHCVQLVKKGGDSGQSRLGLSVKGERWLAGNLGEQYECLYHFLQSVPSHNDPPLAYSVGDARFLGVNVTAAAVGDQAAHYYSHWTVDPKDRQALRDSVYQALAVLPVDVFHRLDNFLAHAAFAEHNPVLLGLRGDQVRVFREGSPVPPFDEELEEAGRVCLAGLIGERLIPFGALRAGVDAQGHICIARHPRLDVYFGREAVDADWADAGSAARVVVQPDFSVIVIGPNPAPAAELAPFCERRQGHAGQGAIVFRITREAVVKAVTHGFAAEEILTRLRHHAGNSLPANVVREVQEWCAWVRPVQASTVTVLRCPDKASADRLLSALGRQGERLNDTLVGLPREGLTAAERRKLRDQGLLVQDPIPGKPEKTAGKKKRRRY